MKVLQNSVLGGNKLNCFKATQVLWGPTQILIWRFEIAKNATRPQACNCSKKETLAQVFSFEFC